MRVPFRPCLSLLGAVLIASVASIAQAATVRSVQVRGVPDERMHENIDVALSLNDALGKTVGERRLEYLLKVAEDEAREALEPFGYYTPTIRVQSTRSGEDVAVVIEVAVGEPVRVRDAKVAISGEGGVDRYLRAELDAFRPRRGDVLDHAVYEAAKTRISRRLAERGYFDADFASRRVEVTRAAAAADIDLVWDSGIRYDMGQVTFEQSPRTIIRPDVLERLIYWKQGEYYHQGRLERLRRSLAALDYFNSIDIQPHPELAVAGEVPVTVTLTPAKRSIYTLGVSYGTLTGAGFSAGVERRYLNARGHKALAQIDWARLRKTATLQYRVPAFAWLDGWYTGTLQYADEQASYIDTRRLEFIASRSGQVTPQLNAVLSLHVLRERWGYYDQTDPRQPLSYRYASLFYPALSADYVKVDNPLAPRDGLSLRGRLLLGRAGSSGLFGQAYLRGSWFRPIGDRDRLIVRGELGRTFNDTLEELPPSLRFYAGGDRSIRGYNWREIGPRLRSPLNPGTYYALGGRNLVTASVEYEHFFSGAWGMAAFVDSGSAFNGRSPQWRTGVGLGLRWTSPVGPVRIDVARGLDAPDSRFTIHLGIGADL